MNTNAAKQEAEVRHRYMEQIIEQFMKDYFKIIKLYIVPSSKREKQKKCISPSISYYEAISASA